MGVERSELNGRAGTAAVRVEQERAGGAVVDDAVVGILRRNSGNERIGG